VLDPNTFAVNWIAAWNARDLPAVLSMFADDVRFSSPKAPNGETNGKDELFPYWAAALDKIPSLRFDLIEAHAAEHQLYIHYRAALNETTYRALELFTFRPDGLVAEAHAFYGAILITE
jgi:ketosteroid isomerase-like protein